MVSGGFGSRPLWPLPPAEGHGLRGAALRCLGVECARHGLVVVDHVIVTEGGSYGSVTLLPG